MHEQEQPQDAAKPEGELRDEAIEDLEPDSEDTEAVKGGITWTWGAGGAPQT
jgi:hypothetical protein